MMIASAVVVPESDPKASPTGSPTLKKRRQSSHSSTLSASKRPRLNDDRQEANTAAVESIGIQSIVPPVETALPSTGDRRRSGANASERQRSRRLFGALLGPAAKPVVNTKSSNAAHQRGLEAEKRQAARQAELAAQAEENGRVLLAQREADQKVWDEESRRLRWETERHQARFLRTSGKDGECVLYWRPWDMTESQKRTITEQVEETKARIVGEGGREEEGTTIAGDAHDKMAIDDSTVVPEDMAKVAEGEGQIETNQESELAIAVNESEAPTTTQNGEMPIVMNEPSGSDVAAL